MLDRLGPEQTADPDQAAPRCAIADQGLTVCSDVSLAHNITLWINHFFLLLRTIAAIFFLCLVCFFVVFFLSE